MDETGDGGGAGGLRGGARSLGVCVYVYGEGGPQAARETIRSAQPALLGAGAAGAAVPVWVLFARMAGSQCRRDGAGIAVGSAAASRIAQLPPLPAPPCPVRHCSPTNHHTHFQQQQPPPPRPRPRMQAPPQPPHQHLTEPLPPLLRLATLPPLPM